MDSQEKNKNMMTVSTEVAPLQPAESGEETEKLPRVVIVGGGFGSLAAAKALKFTTAQIILIDCDRGSWAGRRPRLGGYVTRMGPTDGATAAGGHCPQGNPVQFPDSHSIPTSIPIEFPRIDVSGRTLGTR